MTPITPRGIEINPDAALPFEAARTARHLLRTARTACLGTLDPAGYPYTTVTNLVCEPTGVPFFFAAGLTVHARNIEADNRISLTVAEASGDVMTTARLTLSGRAIRVGPEETDALKTRYHATFPKSKLYLSLPDTRLYRMEAEAIQMNGGPGRNANGVTPELLLTDINGAAGLMDNLAKAIAHLNEGDRPQRLASLAGSGTGRWRAVSLDPDGIDLATATKAERYWFAERVTSLDGLMNAVLRVPR